MATYKAIKGLKIQTFSGDHPNAAAGDVWYNSTLGKLRVHKVGAGAWSSGANYPAARKMKTSFFGKLQIYTVFSMFFELFLMTLKGYAFLDLTKRFLA